MVWGNGTDKAGAFAATEASGFGGATVKNLLSFNEPDLGGQADMLATDAAALHIATFTDEIAGKYRIGAPAISWNKVSVEHCVIKADRRLKIAIRYNRLGCKISSLLATESATWTSFLFTFTPRV